MKNYAKGSLCMLGLAWLAFSATGCNRTDPQTGPQAAAGHSHPSHDGHDHGGEEAGHDDHHEHAPGAHGGMVIAIGRESYHAEPLFLDGGRVRLFLLGPDETRVQEVPVQEFTAYARAAGNGTASEISFLAIPQAGDAEGMTSAFEATIPDGLRGGQVEITIPRLVIGEDRFRVQFSSPAADHAMPASASRSEAEQLYLTPGGLYTEADIEANGRTTAAQKFAGFQSRHDMNPQPGDRICPVTETKANPACSWIINGQKYEFCCPPCVDEFLKLAKSSPDQIREPAFYTKQ